MPGPANVIILAEDTRAANLLRRYAERALHVSNNRIRVLIAPKGAGDAKDFVLEQYSSEVRSFRSGHISSYLIVHLDADGSPLADRQKQLADSLKRSLLAPRAQDERIAHVIMARHVETWLAALTGQMTDREGKPLDEYLDCKRMYFPPQPDRLVRDAASTLYDLTRPNANHAPLASIVAAVPELQRLEH